MRYTLRAILILITAVAVVIAIVRGSWSRWPDETRSVLIGLAVWICIVIAFRLFMTSDLPRNLSSTLLAILIGVAWMIAFKLSVSLPLLFVGFMAGATGTLVVAQFLSRILAWCGVETENSRPGEP